MSSELGGGLSSMMGNSDLLEFRQLVGQLGVLVQRARKERRVEWLDAIEELVSRLGPLLESDPEPKPLDTYNRFAIQVQPLSVGEPLRVVALASFGQIWEPEQALQLAAWLIVGAELAGYEQPLEVAVATVKAIRNA